MQANYLLEEGQKKEKAVVMAGCVSQAAPNETWLKGISIVGVKQIDRVVEVVEETLKGNMGESHFFKDNQPGKISNLCIVT